MPSNERNELKGVKPPIEPKYELIEIRLQMLGTNAMVTAPKPAFQIGENQMADRQEGFTHVRITLPRNRQMPIAAFTERVIAIPSICHDYRPRRDRSLNKPTERTRCPIRDNLHPKSPGVSSVPTW